MMRKLYFLFLIFVFKIAFGQNTIIKNNGTDILPSPYYYCDGESFNLSVDDYNSSNTFSFSRQNFSIYSSYFTPTGENNFEFESSSRQNSFSKSVRLGFDFNFYGKNYNSIVIGSNGRILLGNDTELESLYQKINFIDRPFSSLINADNRKELPSASYNEIYNSGDITRKFQVAQIFAGYTAVSGIYTSTNYKYRLFDNGGDDVGIAISFNRLLPIRQESNNSISDYSVFTSKVILYKDGRVVISVSDKIDFRYNAILGLQNEDASLYYVPIHKDNRYNYNNNIWDVEKSEEGTAQALVFRTGITRTPRYSWKLNGAIVSETRNFSPSNFTPNDNDKVEVNVSFEELNNNPLNSEITFRKLQKPQITNPNYSSGCGQPATLEIISPDSNLKYDWYKNGVLYESNRVKINADSGDYFVRVNGNNCHLDSDAKTVNISSVIPPITTDSLVSICDSQENINKTIDLHSITNYPINNSLYTIVFLDSNNQPISNLLSINSGNKKKFKIRVETISGVNPACSVEKEFEVEYQSFPQNGTTITSPKLCYGTSNYSVADFKRDFPDYALFDVKFSTDGINFNLDDVNPSTQHSIKVRLSKSGFNCSSDLNLNFDFQTIEIKPITTFAEHCTSTTEFFDLNITKRELEYDPNIQATFYTDSNYTNVISNLNFRGSGTVYIKVTDISTRCFNTTSINLVVYRKPTLLKPTPEVKNSICGTSTYNLTLNIDDYIRGWTRHLEIRYYRQNGTRLIQNEWENYNPNSTDAAGTFGQPYAVLIYNSTENLECSDRIEYQLIENKKPIANGTPISICDETEYPLSQFKNQVITNSSNYKFLAEDRTTELTSNINLSILPYSFRFYIQDTETGCISDLQTVNFVQGNPASLLSSVVTIEPKCDTDFDGITTFNLDDYKNQFTNNPAATFEYFVNGQRVNANFTNTQPFEQTIRVRITTLTDCPVEATLILKVNTPTKSSTLQDKYFICYGETVEIDAGAENTTFAWSNGGIARTKAFIQAGTYSVTLTNDLGCKYTHQFIISDENQPKIQQINHSEHQIEVLASGKYNIEYSFDNGRTWQVSNIKMNPTEEQYDIRIRSVLAENIYCLGEPRSIYSIQIHNTITPNGDGKNDYWEIKNLDKMEQVEIIVTDRFGKMVFQSTDKIMKWDGKQNGRELPTATYWYVVKWFDATRQKSEVRQGWILLKNRD